MRMTIPLFSACVAASLGSAALLFPSAAPAAVPIEVVVTTGDPLPDSNPFDGGLWGAINDAGQISFWSPGHNSIASQFRWDPSPSEFVRIVAPGLTVPGGSGVFSWFSTSSTLNDAGQTVFRGSLAGSPPDGTRLYRSDGATLVEIVRRSDPAPGGNGTIDSFSPLNGILNNAGEVAFLGYLTGTSGGGADDEALYRGDGATLIQVVREGEPAAGDDGSFQTFSPPSLNTPGQLGFRGYLTGASGGNNEGFFRADGTPGGVVEIARKGDPVPGGGAVLGTFNTYTPSLNDSGQIAFIAGLYSSVAGFIGEGVFVGDGGPLAEIARSGNPAPGGGTLGSLTSALVNGAGQVAFGAKLSGVGGSLPAGIYRRDAGGGALVPIVRTGQQAPDGNGTFDLLEGFALNDAGQVVFRAYLAGGSGPQGDHGIFLHDDAAGLVQLLRMGDPLLGSSVLELGLVTQVDQDRRSLNDRGQVSFGFVLDDFRNGIAIAVPEPRAGLPIAALVGLYGVARFRRGRTCAGRGDGFAITRLA